MHVLILNYQYIIMALHLSRVIVAYYSLPKFSHYHVMSFSTSVQYKKILREFGGIKKFGIDWDQTLQDGDSQTKETLRRSFEKYEIPLSKLEVSAKFVRAHTKVAWGCRIAKHFIPADTHIVKSVNPSVLQTIFDPIYSALMHNKFNQHLAQTIALDVSMYNKQLDKNVVKTVLLKYGIINMLYADIIMDFIKTGIELPQMHQSVPLEPSSVLGICPIDLQMFMRPAYFGLMETDFFTPKEATNIALYFTDISRATSLEVAELLPGAIETLLLLQKMHMQTFVFSNKCEVLLNAEVKKFGIDKLIARVHGSTPGKPLKPDAEMVTSVVSYTKNMAFIDDRPSGIYLAHKIGAIPILFNSGNLSTIEIAHLNPAMVVSSHDELQVKIIILEKIIKLMKIMKTEM